MNVCFLGKCTIEIMEFINLIKEFMKLAKPSLDHVTYMVRNNFNAKIL